MLYSAACAGAGGDPGGRNSVLHGGTVEAGQDQQTSSPENTAADQSMTAAQKIQQQIEHDSQQSPL